MTGGYLSTAHELGRRLAGEAIWYRKLCNWISPTISPGPRSFEIRHESLDGDLYQGTSGIALFLAELARATDDTLLRTTAIGAIAHALQSAASRRPGLYIGGWGIAVAAGRIARLLEDDDLSARALVAAEGAVASEPQAFDLLSGRAGEILGCLFLAALSGDQRWVARARDDGLRLIAAGQGRNGHGLSWPPPGRARGRHLLGLSHGAAGAALALLRLYEVTGEKWFAERAADAVAYEDRFFDPTARNWPDLRHAHGRGSSMQAPLVTLWCHGSPGIALSRLHASRLLPIEAMTRDLQNAVASTSDVVRLALAGDGHSFCLCHGIAGNADILLSCDGHGNPELAARAAEEGIRRYRASGRWPCGLPGASVTPGLFLGLSGIGYFYLRLDKPDVPSVLDPDPAQLAAP